MNDPDSISDPVARRLRCTESYPSARGSARLQHSSAQLGSAQLGSSLMTWQVGPTMLMCQLTGRWHGMPTVHACVMMTSSLSGSGTWVGSSGVRVGPAYPGEEAACDAWAVTSPAREDISDVRFRRRFHRWLRLFLLYTVIWLKHHFDNFYFWAKIKHHFKACALIPIVGDSGSPCADRWCSDICPKEAKHTDTIFNVVWQIAYIHGRESILLEIEKGNNTNTWRRRITSLKLYSQLSLLHLQLLQWQQGCCHCSSLFLSTLFTFSQPSTQFALLSCCLFIGKNGGCINGASTWVAPFCQWLVQLPL